MENVIDWLADIFTSDDLQNVIDEQEALTALKEEYLSGRMSELQEEMWKQGFRNDINEKQEEEEEEEGEEREEEIQISSNEAAQSAEKNPWELLISSRNILKSIDEPFVNNDLSENSWQKKEQVVIDLTVKDFSKSIPKKTIPIQIIQIEERSQKLTEQQNKNGREQSLQRKHSFNQDMMKKNDFSNSNNDNSNDNNCEDPNQQEDLQQERDYDYNISTDSHNQQVWRDHSNSPRDPQRQRSSSQQLQPDEKYYQSKNPATIPGCLIAQTTYTENERVSSAQSSPKYSPPQSTRQVNRSSSRSPVRYQSRYTSPIVIRSGGSSQQNSRMKSPTYSNNKNQQMYSQLDKTPKSKRFSRSNSRNKSLRYSRSTSRNKISRFSRSTSRKKVIMRSRSRSQTYFEIRERLNLPIRDQYDSYEYNRHSHSTHSHDNLRERQREIEREREREREIEREREREIERERQREIERDRERERERVIEREREREREIEREREREIERERERERDRERYYRIPSPQRVTSLIAPRQYDYDDRQQRDRIYEERQDRYFEERSREIQKPIDDRYNDIRSPYSVNSNIGANKYRIGYDEVRESPFQQSPRYRPGEEEREKQFGAFQQRQIESQTSGEFYPYGDKGKWREQTFSQQKAVRSNSRDLELDRHEYKKSHLSEYPPQYQDNYYSHSNNMNPNRREDIPQNPFRSMNSSSGGPHYSNQLNKTFTSNNQSYGMSERSRNTRHPADFYNNFSNSNYNDSRSDKSMMDRPGMFMKSMSTSASSMSKSDMSSNKSLSQVYHHIPYNKQGSNYYGINPPITGLVKSQPVPRSMFYPPPPPPPSSRHN